MLAEWLSEAHDPVPVPMLSEAVQRVASGQADLLVADALFAFDARLLAACRATVTRTPLVAVGDPGRAAETARRSGAFHVERPVDRELFMCSIAMGLAEARPLRRSPRKPIARFESSADGVGTAVIDVSNEGMRLEIARPQRAALPPLFTVRLPLVGFSVRVRRVWVAARPHAPASGNLWCGVALVENGAREEREWRKFVDLVPRLT